MLSARTSCSWFWIFTFHKGPSTRCTHTRPPPKLKLRSQTVPTCVRKPCPTAWTEADAGAGRGETRGARAVVAPSARSAAQRLPRLPGQPPALRSQSSGAVNWNRGRGGGNGCPPPGPIEGLESPICKYEGPKDPKVGRARVEVRGCKTANGSVSQSFLEGARKYGC